VSGLGNILKNLTQPFRDGSGNGTMCGTIEVSNHLFLTGFDQEKIGHDGHAVDFICRDQSNTQVRKKTESLIARREQTKEVKEIAGHKQV
jgi:hypothetical protein